MSGEYKMQDIRIYSKDYCPYCKAAKILLTNNGFNFEEIDVAKQPARFHEMVSLSGRRTVPQIFFGNGYVGGYDDLVGFFQFEVA